VAGKNKVENFTLSTAELPAVATFYRISNAASASWPFVRLSVWPDFFLSVCRSVNQSVSHRPAGPPKLPKKNEKK